MKLFNRNCDDVSSFTGFLQEAFVFITLENLLVLSRCLAHSNSKQDVLTVLRYYLLHSFPRIFLFNCSLFKRDAEFGYKATKEEVHPNPVGNGRSTIEFFRDSFAMTGREVVALMGAHTFGKPHFRISMFPYTWTSKATNLWTNDYYKAITGRPR